MPSEVPPEPLWVPFEVLVDVNRRVTSATGEPHLVLSVALLESAWAKPVNRWSYQGEDDPVRLAVALMVAVAANHPFQQGNKRTAFEGGLAFLRANGLRLDPSRDEVALADAFVAVIAHKLGEAEFAEDLRPHVRPAG